MTLFPPTDDQTCAEAGFSLLEVLVALSISAFAVGAFQLLLVEQMAMLDLASEQAAATDYAMSTLAALGVESPISVGQFSGQYKDGMSYTLMVTKTDGSETQSRFFPLYHVDLTVMWGTDEDRHVLAFETQRLGNTFEGDG